MPRLALQHFPNFQQQLGIGPIATGPGPRSPLPLGFAEDEEDEVEGNELGLGSAHIYYKVASDLW